MVSIAINESGGKVTSCELTAPQSLSFGKALPVELVAAAISVDPKEVVTKTHGPQVVSVGLPFIFVERIDCSVLERARINMSGFVALAAQNVMPDVYLYTQGTDGFDIRARMFASLSGVPEDPATGSANCTLAGLLAHYNQDRDGSFSWRIAQGVEMGPRYTDRPCGKKGRCRPNDSDRRRRRPSQRRDDLPRLDSRSSRQLKK